MVIVGHGNSSFGFSRVGVLACQSSEIDIFFCMGQSTQNFSWLSLRLVGEKSESVDSIESIVYRAGSSWKQQRYLCKCLWLPEMAMAGWVHGSSCPNMKASILLYGPMYQWSLMARFTSQSSKEWVYRAALFKDGNFCLSSCYIMKLIKKKPQTQLFRNYFQLKSHQYNELTL